MLVLRPLPSASRIAIPIRPSGSGCTVLVIVLELMSKVYEAYALFIVVLPAERMIGSSSFRAEILAVCPERRRTRFYQVHCFGILPMLINNNDSLSINAIINFQAQGVNS